MHVRLRTEYQTLSHDPVDTTLYIYVVYFSNFCVLLRNC